MCPLISISFLSWLTSLIAMETSEQHSNSNAVKPFGSAAAVEGEGQRELETKGIPCSPFRYNEVKNSCDTTMNALESKMCVCLFLVAYLFVYKRLMERKCVRKREGARQRRDKSSVLSSQFRESRHSQTNSYKLKYRNVQWKHWHSPHWNRSGRVDVHCRRGSECSGSLLLKFLLCVIATKYFQISSTLSRTRSNLKPKPFDGSDNVINEFDDLNITHAHIHGLFDRFAGLHR